MFLSNQQNLPILLCTVPILATQTSLSSLFCLPKYIYNNLLYIPSVLNCARNNSLFFKILIKDHLLYITFSILTHYTIMFVLGMS